MCLCRYRGPAASCPREAVWWGVGPGRAERYPRFIHVHIWYLHVSWVCVHSTPGTHVQTWWILDSCDSWSGCAVEGDLYLKTNICSCNLLPPTSSPPPASFSAPSLISLIKLTGFPPTHLTNDTLPGLCVNACEHACTFLCTEGTRGVLWPI